MYKVQYYIPFGKEMGWQDIKSYTIGGDGPALLLKDKQEAIEFANSRHNLYGDKVRVIEWNRKLLRWKIVYER